ncbi:glycosyltransferase [Neobacillus sp. 3P2-tot-E-2]|uniref:glycosyltransferase n=1 Tax=Neobacillus sp. 3P2-tot-E-2 TaxID=3132212 RepID=UPI0039A1D48A
MKITIVVVVYKENPEESKTFRTLRNTLFLKQDLVPNIELILYDNSPDQHSFNPLDYEGVHISYFHDPRNLGIATAYNFAWSIAKENGSQWLLLLDHDTELTVEYFNQFGLLTEMSNDVVAVVPRIFSENTMISPVFSSSLRPLQEKRPVAGLQTQPVMAINSGTLIRVDFINELNGFNESFPLDFLDHWIFFTLYKNGHTAWLLDVTLEHELSVMDYSRVSLKRYQSILNSEINFYKNYKKELIPAYRLQLVKRLVKQVLTVKNKKIALYTLKRLLSI